MAACHVEALPYPGRGHINPMMDLCKSLSSRRDNNKNILITFVVTEDWLGLIGSEAKLDNIRFVTIPNVRPSELVRAADMASFREAVLTKMEEPFEGILDRLEKPPTIIVADTFLPWAVDAGSRRNIPVASFWPMLPSVFSMFHHSDRLFQIRHFPADFPEKAEVMVDNIPGLSPFRLSDLPAIFHFEDQTILHTCLELISKVHEAQYLLFNSVFELESPVIDALQSKFPFPLYSLGPLIPSFNLHHDSFLRNVPDYFKWLDSQPQSSVLYISLGSWVSVSSVQMDEIAAGLHDSGLKYLGVARDESSRLKDSICGGTSSMVVPWCDQLKVLCHLSVGEFRTHCGWNSTLEGVYSGVPLLALPFRMDQLPTSKFIAEDWKIGWKVKGDANDGLVRREEIAELVRRFMDSKSIERKEMARRAGKIRETCRQAIGRGGSSEKNFEAFMKDISK